MDLGTLKHFFLTLLIAKPLHMVRSADVNETVVNNASLDNVFDGVYSECFLHLSYMCLQRKTLLYLKELNNLSEVSVIGDYVKFVKVNSSIDNEKSQQDAKQSDSVELAFMIDQAVDHFFDNHILKFNALGKNITLIQNVEEFVGRKRKGGGGGGGMGHGGGHGGEDGGKKKMMMMAMMCMKMKLMMMVPAMMGMMGMMSFKGMIFSMMSFMLSKMMLLMKLIEKKGGGGSGGFGGGGAGDGGWAAGGGGGGAWMPAGGQDYGGGGGGGYDANGQWQSRSIIDSENFQNIPEISFVKPLVRHNHNIETETYKKPVLVYKKSNVNFNFGKEPVDLIGGKYEVTDRNKSNVRVKRELNSNNGENYDKINKSRSKSSEISDLVFNNKIINDKEKSKKNLRNKRSIMNILQNSYIYWINRILGINNNRRTNYQRYKIINGVKYIYYPYPTRTIKQKTPKEIHSNHIKISDDGFKPVITVDDFNKGEIMEGVVESRMNTKKFNKMKDSVNDTVEDNPWE